MLIKVFIPGKWSFVKSPINSCLWVIRLDTAISLWILKLLVLKIAINYFQFSLIIIKPLLACNGVKATLPNTEHLFLFLFTMVLYIFVFCLLKVVSFILIRKNTANVALSSIFYRLLVSWSKIARHPKSLAVQPFCLLGAISTCFRKWSVCSVLEYFCVGFFLRLKQFSCLITCLIIAYKGIRGLLLLNVACLILWISRHLVFPHFLYDASEWINVSSFFFTQLTKLIVSQKSILIHIKVFEHVSYLLPRILNMQLVYNKWKIWEWYQSCWPQIKEPECTSNFSKSFVYFVT